MSDSGSVDGFKFYNELRGKNISDSLGKGLLIQRGEGENRRVFRLTNLNAFIHGKVDTAGVWDDSKIDTVLKALKVFSDKQQELEGSEGKVKELAFNLSNDKEASNISYILNGKVTHIKADETFKSGVDEAHNAMIKTLTRLGPEFNAFITKDLNEDQLPEDLFKTFTARFGEGRGLLSEGELQAITPNNIHQFILTNLECAKDLKRHYTKKMKATVTKYIEEAEKFAKSGDGAYKEKAKELIEKIDNICIQGGSHFQGQYITEPLEALRSSLGIERPDTARGAGTGVNFKLNPVPRLDLPPSGNGGIGFGEEDDFPDDLSEVTFSPRSWATEGDEYEDPFSSRSSSTEPSNPDANGDDNYSEASSPRLYMPEHTGGVFSPRSVDNLYNDDDDKSDSESSLGHPIDVTPLGTHHQTMGPMRSNLFTNSNLSTIPEGDENEDEDSVNSEDSEVKKHIPFSGGSSSLEAHEHSSTNLDGSEVPESVFTFPRRGESSEAPTIQRPEKEARVLEEAFQSLIDEPHEYLYNKSDFSKAKLEEVFKWLDDLVGEGRIFKKRDLIKAMVKEPLLAFYVLEYMSKIKEDKENFFTEGGDKSVLKKASSIAEKVDADKFVDVIERFGPDDSYYSQLADTQAYSQTLHILFEKHKGQLKDIVAKRPNDITRTRFILHRAELYESKDKFGYDSSYDLIKQMKTIEEHLKKNLDNRKELLEDLAKAFDHVVTRVCYTEKHTLEYLQSISELLKYEYEKLFSDDKDCERLKTLRRTWQKAVIFSYKGEENHPALDYIKIATQTDYLTLARKENELTELSDRINHLQKLIKEAEEKEPRNKEKISSLKEKRKETIDQFQQDFKGLCENPGDKEAEFFDALDSILKATIDDGCEEIFIKLEGVLEDAREKAKINTDPKSALARANDTFMLLCKKFGDNHEGFEKFLQKIGKENLENPSLYDSYHFAGMHLPPAETGLEAYDLLPLEAMRKSSSFWMAMLYRGLAVEKLKETNPPIIGVSRRGSDPDSKKEIASAYTKQIYHIPKLEKEGQILFHSFDKDDFLHLFKSFEREIYAQERYSFVFRKLKELHFPPSSIDLLYEALKEEGILDRIKESGFFQQSGNLVEVEDNYVVRLLKEIDIQESNNKSFIAESVIEGVAKGLKEEECDGIRFGALIHHQQIKEKLERFKEDLKKVGAPQEFSERIGALKPIKEAEPEAMGLVNKTIETPKTEEDVWKGFLKSLEELKGVPITNNHPMRLEAEILYLNSELKKIIDQIEVQFDDLETALEDPNHLMEIERILNDMDAWKYLDRLEEIQEDLLVYKDIREDAGEIEREFKEKFNLT